MHDAEQHVATSLILDAVTAILCASLAILLAVGALLDLVERVECLAVETVDLLGRVDDVEEC